MCYGLSWNESFAASFIFLWVLMFSLILTYALNLKVTKRFQWHISRHVTLFQLCLKVLFHCFFRQKLKTYLECTQTLTSLLRIQWKLLLKNKCCKTFTTVLPYQTFIQSRLWWWYVGTKYVILWQTIFYFDEEYYLWCVTLLLVGGVAQWLGRRSVAGGLSLIYAWCMVDVWPLRG